MNAVPLLLAASVVCDFGLAAGKVSCNSRNDIGGRQQSIRMAKLEPPLPKNGAVSE